MRMPSDAQIRAFGESLGHGPGPYPTKLRAQLAKAWQLAQGMESDARKDEAVSIGFAARLEQVQADLRRHNISPETVMRVVSAVAPEVYKETRKQETRTS
ncbi:hypothetical protein SEA_UPYO_13 [Gordonia phage Upyo]|nr:hypothetical protein SEA_UPYO_13 [Gordonia phage Upyo]